jgi:uncharacterized protein (DUF433 family)
MKLQEIINIDAGVMSGTPVFNGTRVPIQSLFWHIEEGISIEDFLDDFPSVSRDQIDALLALVGKTFESRNIHRVYEIAA